MMARALYLEGESSRPIYMYNLYNVQNQKPKCSQTMMMAEALYLEGESSCPIYVSSP
jgi:hypothetical protein